jgi:hypothetical protein
LWRGLPTLGWVVRDRWNFGMFFLFFSFFFLVYAMFVLCVVLCVLGFESEGVDWPRLG